MSATKECAGCKQELPVEMFHFNRQQKDGLSCYCKKCAKKTSKQNYAKRASNHEWKLEQALRASKVRANKKGLEHTLTLEQLKSLYPPDNLCPVFGMELSWGFPKDSSPSLDRIDSLKGYTLENCQIISNKANRLKADATLEELLLIVDYLKGF